MKKAHLLAAALLLICIAMGQASAGYTQRMQVQVFDQGFRPVEGAQVYVDRQINAVIGNGKTKPVATGLNGTADIIFSSYEELEGQTDYIYTLYAKYGDQVKSAKLIVTNSSQVRVYSLQVGAYYAFVTVHDQFGKALRARVTAGNTTRETDSSGTARFQLPPGRYNIRAEINGATRNRDVSLSADQAVDIEFPLYTVSVKVLDDFRSPLAAQVDLDGNAKNTTSDGTAAFANVSNEQPKITVRYNNSYRKLQPSLKKDTAFEVVFDLTAPVVQELHHSMQKNGEAAVDAYIQEPGASASGISSVVISYEVGGVTTALPTYTIGYNSFEAKIPAAPKGTLVKYTVKATDKAGNSGFASGTYTIPSEKAPVVQKKDEGLLGITFGWEAVVVAALALGIAAYAILYYRRKRHEREIEAEVEAELPPGSPPSLPPQA